MDAYKSMFYKIKESKVVIDVRVVTNCNATRIRAVANDELVVELNAQPAKNAANDELVRLFAGLAGVRRDKVQIISGLRNRSKVVAIEFLSLGFLKEICE